MTDPLMRLNPMSPINRLVVATVVIKAWRVGLNLEFLDGKISRWNGTSLRANIRPHLEE